MRIANLTRGEQFTLGVIPGHKNLVFKKVDNDRGQSNAIHIGFTGVNDPLSVYSDGARVRINEGIDVYLLR